MSTLKKLKAALDLQKNGIKIHKPFFQVALIIIGCLFIISLITDGTGILLGSPYLECRSDGEPCINPLYDEQAFICDELTCNEYLFPGEVIGDKPSFLSRYFFFLVLVIIGSAAIGNNVYWRRKR